MERKNTIAPAAFSKTDVRLLSGEMDRSPGIGPMFQILSSLNPGRKAHRSCGVTQTGGALRRVPPGTPHHSAA